MRITEFEIVLFVLAAILLVALAFDAVDELEADSSASYGVVLP